MGAVELDSRCNLTVSRLWLGRSMLLSGLFMVMILMLGGCVRLSQSGIRLLVSTSGMESMGGSSKLGLGVKT
ncbi:hypothetical protein BJX70DRAFT_357397 [Aspergillus crustosus]